MLGVTAGDVLRTVTVGVDPVAVAIDEHSSRVFVANDGSGSVSMLDATTGRLLGAVQVGGAPTSIAVDERRGRVFVANDGSGSVSMLDATTGRLLGAVRVGANAVVVDERTGRVFAASMTQPGTDLGDLSPPSVPAPGAIHGSIRVLAAASGTVLRTIHLGRPSERLDILALAVDERDGRVFVAAGDSVSVLDAASGSVLHAVRVGIAPSAVAVDERTGRAFVTHWDNINFHGSVTGIGGVSAIDAIKGTVLKAVPVDVTPIAVAVDQRHRQVLVVNYHLDSDTVPGTVTVIDANAP